MNAVGADVANKTILVTGATSGIGVETVRALAKAKAGQLVLGVRDEKQSAPFVEQLKKETGNQNIVAMTLELGSFKSIRAFAQAYHEKGWPLHVLICNAGVGFKDSRKTEDGLELIVGVNHFGHFLLTTLMMDVLEKSAPSRIVVLTSGMHKGERIKFENIPVPKQYDHITQYKQSKMMNLVFAKELHRRYHDKKISAFAVHPGVIATGMTRDKPCMGCFMSCCFGCCLKSAPQGAATSVYCATATGLEGKSGHYFTDSQEDGGADPAADDAAVAKQLWEVSEKVVESSSAGAGADRI